MAVNPTPNIFFDDAYIQCSATQLDTAPVLLDDLVIDWGRDDYISHAQPATLQFRLYDRTGKWAQKMRDRKVIGRNVYVLWADPNDGSQFFMFRGRCSGADVKPVRKAAGGTPEEWIVDVTASSRDAQLGNIIQPVSTWPRETMIVRANRIKAWSALTGINDFFFYPGSVNITCWPLTVTGKSMKELTDDFYMSMGDTYSYIPYQDNVRHVYRRNYAITFRLYRFPDGLVYVATPDTTYDGVTYPKAVLPACDSSSDDTLSLTPNSAVSRVEVSWKDQPNGNNDVTSAVTGGDTNGRRTVTFTSWIDNGIHIDPMIAQVLARGQEEGSLPKHPQITWDTHRAGGFKSVGEARALLTCGETQGSVTVNGSPFAALLQTVPPVYSLLGGQCRYVDHGWVVTARLQNHQTPVTAAPMAWSQLDTRFNWNNSGAFDFSPSVSWFDLRWVEDPVVYAQA